jgi:hypothetical protein
MKRFVRVSALVAVTLGLSIWTGSPQAYAGVSGSGVAGSLVPEPGAWTPTTSSSRLLLHRRVRCTATVRSEVQVGHAVSVKLTLHSLSRQPVKYTAGVGSAGIVVRASDGTTFDSNGSLAGLPGIPPPLPTTIRPGATKQLRLVAVPVRWSGPLRITPECLGKPLPDLVVRVTSPGPPADPSTAIGEVVGAAGGFLDHCRPQTAGVPVDGQIDAETLWPNGQLTGLAGSQPPYEAIAWEFVVTRDQPIPVAASSLTASISSSQVAPLWDWNGSDWQRAGRVSCGGTGFSWGGRGPEIEFISACPAS